jgi:DNA-binding transcriptional MerR regulator
MSERWTIDELMDVSAAALESADYDGQASSRVRETPDKRTIRYYTTLGLLDRPVEFRGRTAYYGRRHVLQLAAIKRMQAKGMSLVQIQEALAGADDRRLARWSGVPGDFWDGRRPAPVVPPNPDALLARKRSQPTKHETNSTEAAPRAVGFWLAPPTAAAGPPEIVERAASEHNLTPNPAITLCLAEGVTLLIENPAAGRVDRSDLAKLAPAADALVNQLRQLKLIR